MDVDKEYKDISDDIDWNNPKKHVDRLRVLSQGGHHESMTLLAILLGDIDSHKFREEIISLNERAHEMGSAVAAGNLSIQYLQWNEPYLSKLWKNLADNNGVQDT